MDLSSGELDQILSKTLESPEFSNVLGSLTQTIKNNLQSTQQMDDDIENTAVDGENMTTICENLIDILGAYFMDNDGNNICEILKNINNNIEKSNKIQSKLLEKLDQKA